MSEQTKAVFMAWFLGLCAYLPRIEKILGENPLLPWSLPELLKQQKKIGLMFEKVIYDWTSKEIGRKFRRELKTLDEMIRKVFNDLQDVQQAWKTLSDETQEKMIEDRSEILKLLELVESPIENPIPRIVSKIGLLRATMSNLQEQIEQKQSLIVPNQGNDELLKSIQQDHQLNHDLKFQIGKLIEQTPHEKKMYQMKLSNLGKHRSELASLIQNSQKAFFEIITSFRVAKKREEQIRKESEHRKIKIQETEKTIKNSREELSRMVERLSTLEQCRLSLREEYTALFQKSSSDPQLSNFERSLFLKTSDITQLETDVDRLRGKIEMNENSLRNLLAQETPQ
jgi:chromosome segregation ATPase